MLCAADYYSFISWKSCNKYHLLNCYTQWIVRQTLITTHFCFLWYHRIGTVNISSPKAALQRRRRKCGSLTVRVGYRFLCTTSATLWSLAKALNSLRPSDAYICVGNLTIIGADNGLSPGRRQAITWTNVGILLIGPLRTNFSGMLFEIHTFSFKKIHLKMSSGKWRPFFFGLSVSKKVALWSRDAYMCQHKCVR